MHRCDFRLPVRVLAAAALPLMGAATLAGCSGASQHQVIDRNVACSSCHSDEKPVYEGATVPSETVESGSVSYTHLRVESGSRVQVKTSGAAVAVVARPVFTAEDGSGFVPVIDSSVALDGGEAVVELEDGLWALCLDEGDKARAKLVRVDSASDATAVVEL